MSDAWIRRTGLHPSAATRQKRSMPATGHRRKGFGCRFDEICAGLRNPEGDGLASPRIRDALLRAG